MTRCAIYARYSSDLQQDRSIDDQIRNCRDCAKQRSWTVLDSHIYSDRAISGTTLVGRGGLSRLLTAAEARPRPFEYVLIDDTSRLSRNKVEQGTVIRDLLDLGIYIYFVSDGIATNDEITQDVILPVLGIKDSLYCRELAKKTKRGMTGQVLKGFNAGGRTYGYRYSRVPDPSGAIDRKTQQIRSLGTRVEIEQSLAEVVRRIFTMYADGYGFKAIATVLTDANIEPPGSERQIRNGAIRSSWCPNAIRTILRNPKYIGDWTWNRTASTRRSKTGKRTYTARPESDWVARQAPELAIIELPVWEKVCRRFHKQSETYCQGDRASRRKYLLSGLLKCEICGTSLIVADIKRDGEIFYRCGHNWQRGVKACSNSVKVRGSKVEAGVIETLKSGLLAPPMLKIISDEVNRALTGQATPLKSDKSIMKEKRQKLAQDIRRLIALITESDTLLPTVKTAIQQKEQELASVDRQLSTSQPIRPTPDHKFNPADVEKWFGNLHRLMREDVSVARQQLGEVIGILKAKPHSRDGQMGLLFTGKLLFRGVLNLIAEGSNLQNGGGRI